MPRSREWRRRIGGDGQVCGQTFQLQVQASGDDGRRRTGGTNDLNVVLTDSYATGERPAGTDRNAFMRFDNVTVPAGATIELASFDWKSCSTVFDGSGLKSDIHMAAEDDPAAPTTTGEYDALSMTSASTAYDDFDSTLNAWHTSPDFTAAVQEVTDRGGWNSGQAMIIFWIVGAGTTADLVYCAHHEDATDGTEAPIFDIQFCA